MANDPFHGTDREAGVKGAAASAVSQRDESMEAGTGTGKERGVMSGKQGAKTSDDARVAKMRDPSKAGERTFTAERGHDPSDEALLLEGIRANDLTMWETEELREKAAAFGLTDAPRLERDALIAALAGRVGALRQRHESLDTQKGHL